MGVIFVGGNLALDFVGTLNERFSTRVEQLREPADLGRWLVAAGVLDEPPDVSAADLEGAIAVREVLFDVIAREIDGRAPRLTARRTQHDQRGRGRASTGRCAGGWRRGVAER